MPHAPCAGRRSSLACAVSSHARGGRLRFAGEMSALGTAVCWAVGATFFTAAGRTLGSINLNRLRIAIAFVCLCLSLWIVRGAPWPTWATGYQVAYLALSGAVGYVFGDSFGFRSMV